MFEQQYQDYKWIDVQADLYGVISKVFEAAGGGDPPNAIIPFQQVTVLPSKFAIFMIFVVP
jgi:hypothetical protein